MHLEEAKHVRLLNDATYSMLYNVHRGPLRKVFKTEYCFFLLIEILWPLDFFFSLKIKKKKTFFKKKL